jgi:hypothetical protein
MRIKRTLVVSCIVAIGLAAGLGSATIAENPFLIDGVVTDASNSKAIGEAAKDTDAHGNVRELGPVQGSSTKFPVIHSALPNMLGLSNPNGQTDLHEIYTQTQKDAAGNAWFYFGWSRMRIQDPGSSHSKLTRRRTIARRIRPRIWRTAIPGHLERPATS